MNLSRILIVIFKLKIMQSKEKDNTMWIEISFVILVKANDYDQFNKI